MSMLEAKKQPMFHVLILLGAVALLALLAGGCSNNEKTKIRIRPNVVFVIIDTLRKDHVGIYGYHRDTSPFIDSLAKGGTTFENVISQSSWTLPSIASIFTSRYPHQIGAGAFEGPDGIRYIQKYSVTPLRESELTIAEIMNANGYRTDIVSTNFNTSGEVGLYQGFSSHSFQFKKPANVVVDQGIEFINKLISEGNNSVGSGVPPFFLCLHFLDVHGPNWPPEEYRDMYPAMDKAPHTVEQGMYDYMKGLNLDTNGFKVYRSHKIALYDASINFVDGQLKRFSSFLKENHLDKDTIYVISSDHGEEFWDHALYEKKLARFDPRGKVYGTGHGHSMFKELLEVPLIISGRGVPLLRVKQQVRNIDIMPTVLGLVGIKTPDNKMDGIDLFEKLEKGELSDMPAFSEDVAYGHEIKSLQRNGFKYIRYYGDGGMDLLFNKKKDPDETNNVSAENPEVLKGMKSYMDSLLKQQDSFKNKPLVLSKEDIEKLRALGYVH